MLWVRSHATTPHMLIGVCYRSPNSESSFASDFHDVLHEITLTNPSTPILLFGDFNFPFIDWSKLSTCQNTDNVSNEFLHTCLTFGLSQLVTSPTRTTDHSSNVLDLLLTSHPDNFSSLSYISGLSDHTAIHTTFPGNMIKKSVKSKKLLTLYDKADYVAMNNDLAAFYSEFSSTYDQQSTESNWALFKSKMQDLIKLYIPTITICERSRSPWFNVNIKRMKNKKKRQFRSARQSNSQLAWDKYKSTAKEYMALLALAKRNFFSTTLPNMLRDNPRRFWKIMKPDDKTTLSLCDNSGSPIADCDVPSVLNSAFCSVFTNEASGELPEYPHFAFPQMPKIEFSSEGIVNVINQLKNSSSCGIDGINAKILKNTKHISGSILSIIFQQSLDTGEVPLDWRIGKVIPVFKKGDRLSAGNYRPISLTSVCSKIMEHVIFSHVASFLSSASFFHPNQHGFRKGHSCETQLTLFLHDIHLHIDRNIPVDTLFLDFEKAFDKVPHSRLLLKVSRLSLHQYVFNWIKAFLTNRKQFVHVNNLSSNLSPVLSGVPQGTVLGPLLFLIYINDIPLSVQSNIRLFADDCVLYRPIHNSTDVSSLQHDLLRIQQWCNTWLMSLNTNKTLLISFHRRRNYAPATYTINNCPIAATNSIKYLGVHLTSDLSWGDHIDHIAYSANRALGYVRRNIFMAPPSVKLLAYITIVRPKLEYASAVFDPHQTNHIKILESVQNRAARFIASDYSRYSSISNLKNQLKLPTLAFRRHIARLCLFHKFFHSATRDNQLIQPVHRGHRRSHPNAVIPPRAHTTSFQQSFFLRTARDWNDLPEEAAVIRDSARFRNAIQAADSTAS